MKLSVVILNYNVRYFLELCLKSVEAAIVNIDAEIIVVDNNSEDDSCMMVKKTFPNVVLIENKENSGFSKGNNIGVAQAKGAYVCILNPDTVVAEDVFVKLLNFSENKQNLGAVGCKLINGSGVFLPESKRNIPFIKSALLKLIGISKYYYASHIKENDILEVPVLVGAFMFMKRSLFDKIGGFDEDYFMYGEDIDLSYRILKAGYANYYYGGVTTIHFKGESTLKDKFYAKRFYGAMQIFYKKHFKKNSIFDMLVWSGITLVYMFRKLPVNKPKNIYKYVLVSDKMNPQLKKILRKDVTLQSDFKNIKKNTEVIFDSKVLSFKKIISMMESNTDNKFTTFKILPKESNFILGSDNAISRGEIIVFN